MTRAVAGARSITNKSVLEQVNENINHLVVEIGFHTQTALGLEKCAINKQRKKVS